MKNNVLIKWWNRIKVAVPILVLVIIANKSYATHIVGGNISYRYISDDIYEITVQVRRDCINGDPEAYFDDPASIGIFDANGAIITSLGVKGQVLIHLDKVNFVDPNTETFCTPAGLRSVCVHETTYKGRVSLPFRKGGYWLEYQRCCRNQPLVNIIDPLRTGASWVVNISEESLKLFNSSPAWVQWSKIYMCVNMPFKFDHHAADPDGDSIVYKLWTPFSGATKEFPKPQPPNSPDFNPVAWSGPYSESDQLSGPDKFKINPVTGELTATPWTIGQFVLGVKVEEYRNGKFLGAVFRDFEVAVLDCNDFVDASIDVNPLQCDLTVKFSNTNIGAKSVKWFFDFDHNKSATSTESKPNYTYSAYGTYRVALVATKDSTCYDTSFATITIRDISSIKPNFIAESGDCINGKLNLRLIDLSTGIVPSLKYVWTIQSNGNTIKTSERNPVVAVDNGAKITVTLDLSDEGSNCKSTMTKTFIASFIKPEYHLDQLVVCTGDTTKVKFIIADSIKGRFTYTWNPDPIIVDGANTPEPVISPKVNQAKYLYVTVDNKNGCSSRDSILIISKTKPRLDFTVMNANGSLDAKFTNTGDQVSTYHWDFGVSGTNADTANTRDASYKYPAAGRYTITLCTMDGCAPCVSKNLNIGNAPMNFNDTINACAGTTVKLNRNPVSGYFYKWSPANKVNDPNAVNPTFVVDSARTFTAMIFDANGISIGTLTVVVLTPTVDSRNGIKDTVVACAGVPVPLNPKPNNDLKYQWSPATGLDNPTSPNPKATVTTQTTYTVVITDPRDNCTVPPKNTVVVVPTKIAADAIPDSVDACINTPVALNPNGKTDPNLKYKWTPATGLDDANSINPKATVTQPTTYTVTITDTRFDNCSVTKTVKVNIPLVIEGKNIPDSVVACAGVPVPVNPKGDSRFKYEWTPVAGLDNPNLANPKATVNQTTIFNVKITDDKNGGCSINKSVKVKVPPAFTVVPTFTDSVSCTSNVFKLGVKSNNPNVKFEWFDGNTSIAKTDTVTVTPTGKKTYRVVGTDENGCQTSATVNVDPAKIEIKAIAPNGGAICQGDEAKLGVSGVNPNQEVTYQWTPINQIKSGANTATPTISPNVSVTYKVTVTNKQGCASSDSVLVKVNPVTKITASASPTTITIGESSRITSTVVTGYTYKWDPADGLDNPTSPNPTAKPKQTTTYTLTATSPDGCIQKVPVTITVNIPDCGEPYIFLPNAFTPNGDGKNDLLCVRSNIIATMTLIIYNRWGEKVFETTNQSVCWDGTYKGTLANPDVYGYYLTVTCINGKTYMKKGNVTVLR